MPCCIRGLYLKESEEGMNGEEERDQDKDENWEGGRGLYIS